MKDMKFRIVRGYEKDTMVIGIDSNGNEYPIIHFNEDGSFTRIPNMPIDSGFKLTMTNKFGVGQQIEEKEFKYSTGEGPQACRAGLRDREAGLRANEQLAPSPTLPDDCRMTANEIQNIRDHAAGTFTPPVPTPPIPPHPNAFWRYEDGSPYLGPTP